MMFKYEADPDFNAKDPSTWYEGDLLRFVDNRVIGTQNLFSVIHLVGDKVRLMVKSKGHGVWYELSEVVWVARPLFPD